MTIFVSKNSQQGDSDDPPPKKKSKKSKSLIRSQAQAHVVNLPTTSTGAGPSHRLPEQIGLFPFLQPQQTYFTSPERESYISSPQHFFNQPDQEILKFELDKFDVSDSDPYNFDEDYSFQDPAVPGTSKIVSSHKSHSYNNPNCLEYYIYGPGSHSPNSKACRSRPRKPLPDVNLIEVISSEEIISQDRQCVKSEDTKCEGGSLLDDINNFDIDDKFGELEKFQQEAIWEDTRMYHMEKSLDAGVMVNGYDKITTPEGPQYEGRLLRNSPAASLSNLGNTCFLNSVLYTLRFAPNFLHNLHHLVTDMNLNTNSASHVKQKTSSLGRNMNLSWSGTREATGNGTGDQPAQVKTKKQIVTEKLHGVYHAMKTAESKEHIDPFHPDVFLTALREVNPIFEGNQQQDAHELLVCLLDIFREASKASARQAETRAALEINSLSAGCQTETDSPVLKLSSPNSMKPWSGMMAMRTSLKIRTQDRLKSRKNEKNLNNLSNSKKKNKRELDRVESMEASENGEETPGTLEQGPERPEAVDRVQMSHNFVAQDFEGVMVLQTTCLECENTTEKKEPFADICVPIKTDYNDDDDDPMDPMNPSELYQRAVVTDEFLRDRNKYYCEECRRYNEARRSVRYQSLPRLLTLQLKRFSSTYGAMSKVTQYMPTPMTLTCFCQDCRGVGVGPKGRSPTSRHGYVLYGVIMHLGPNMAGGHYIAYVKTSDSLEHYRTCAREKPRKASSLSSESGKNHKVNNKIYNLFKNKAACSATINDKVAETNLVSPRKLCQSLDCCGVRGRGSEGEGPAGEEEESLWFACDDDNVKLLRGSEVEELLAKNSTSNATPYLLFYSRRPE